MINPFMESAAKSLQVQKNIVRTQKSETVQVNIRIPVEMKYKLRKHALETDETITSVINRLLEKEFG